MSKERLEDIDYRKDVDTNGYIVIDKLDYEFLYEQAERVQELEGIIHKDERQAVLESMHEENKRYREALEFYADESNYVEHYSKVSSNWHDFPVHTSEGVPVENDAGEKARKALEDE